MSFLVLWLLCLGSAFGNDRPSAARSAPIEETPVGRSSRDEVIALPGLDDGRFESKHHAGYLTVDSQRRSHLYYYFVESEDDPANDPLVLWLNGGPGCSSFDGFVYEHGPFAFDYNDGDVKLSRNPHAWTKVANVIYLDSPAGTGMSYSEGVDQYETDDFKTAKDLHAAVMEFMKIFPEFAENQFFVAGESYAGIYVPMLVSEIVEGNEAKMTPAIPLTGYLVGNGVTDWCVLVSTRIPFAHGKSLISNEEFEKISTACDGIYCSAMKGSDCYNLQDQVYEELFTPPLNTYDVSGKCANPPKGIANDGLTNRSERLHAFIEKNGWVWPFGPVPATGLVHNWRNAANIEPPCTDYWTAETWLNRDDVREAIHAAPIDITGSFYLCSEKMTYTKKVASVVDLHKFLVTQKGLHALIYSGDHDFSVPHTDTEMWTSSLGLKRLYPWKAWIDPEGQVGGYHVEYQGLTYCTIRNAGHMVPQTHPIQALEMFRRFLKQFSMDDDPTGEPSLPASQFVY